MATIEKTADILYIVTQKSNGYQVYVVQSSTGGIYHVTVARNVIRSCDCPAGSHQRRCHHRAAVQARLDADMMAEIAQAEPVATPAAITDEERRNYAPLNGNRSFSLLKQ